MTSYSHRQSGTLVLTFVGLVLVFCVGSTLFLLMAEPRRLAAVIEAAVRKHSG